MKKLTLSILVLIFCAITAVGQSPTAEQEIKDLSKTKWQWMADKNVENLGELL